MMSLRAKSKLPLILAVVLTAGSLALAPLAYAKHASFDLPACDRLMDDQGPSTTASTADGNSADKKGSRDLSPMKLTDDGDSYSLSKDGQVKMSVEKDVNNQANQDSQAQAQNQSDSPETAKSVVKDKNGELLVKQAKKINVGPLALQESEEEAEKKADTISDAERLQLTDLWSATINRSPDIQFVINRLQPTSDPNHATATALKLLSGALFSAVQAVPMMMMPAGGMGSMTGMAMYSGIGSGTGMLQQLLAGNQAKNAKKQQISQEQATILYKIVRDTADRLVAEYRRYRGAHNDYDRAVSDLEDLKAMVAQARTGQDPAKAIEMEYTLRKEQRDIEKINDEARLHRQALADLAGPEAVEKLDSEIDQEQIALQKLTGGEGLKADLEAQPDKISNHDVPANAGGIKPVPDAQGEKTATATATAPIARSEQKPGTAAQPVKASLPTIQIQLGDNDKRQTAGKEPAPAVEIH